MTTLKQVEISPVEFVAEVYSPTDDMQTYIAGKPDAGIFTDPRLGLVMQQAYGNKVIYLAAQCGGKITGLLQMVLQKSVIFGTHLCSLPYMDACGIVADNVQTENLLLDNARRCLKRYKAKWVELRHYRKFAADMPTRTDKVTLRGSLPRTSEQFWNDIGAKARNQIRKAQKAGITAKSGKDEMIDDFYCIYSRTMRDLGSPSHSRKFFKILTQTMHQECEIFCTYGSDGAPLAAAYTLTDKWGAYIPWAGSDWRSSDNPNMLLYWTMLETWCNRGVKNVDFGRSTIGSGTHLFKKKWLAQDVQLYWQYLLAEGQSLPEIKHDNPKFRFAENCWKRLPLFAARLLGPAIIRKLS